MAIPDFQSLMLPFLLATTRDELTTGAIVETLAVQFALTADERALLLPSGRQTTFANRVHWAKFYLSKAGLIENTGRGRFKLSDVGQKAIDEQPVRIDIKYLNRFSQFRSFRDRTLDASADHSAAAAPTAPAPAILPPDEVMRQARSQLDAELGADLLDRILKSPPAFFERLVVQLLAAMSFGGTTAETGQALGRSGDDGVDGVINQDPLGLDRIYVQAKRYALGNNVGAGAVRDFFGSLDRFKASKGIFFTTSSFSAAARETAEFLSKRIVLIDGDQLTKLMIRYDVGCRVQETLSIKTLDEDFFE